MIAELAATQYLAGHGFPEAESTLSGITGTGRILWDVTSLSAEDAGDTLLTDWIEDTRRAATRRGAALGVLVTPRQDYGTNRVASWWAHVDVSALTRAMRGALVLPDDVSAEPVRMNLSTAVLLTRAAGYGAPLGMEETA